MQHYFWLYDYMMSLGKEYTKRYKKKHLTISKCAEVLFSPPEGMQNGHFFQPPQCMPDEYKVLNNSIKAYWDYYINDKKSIINKDEIPYTNYPFDVEDIDIRVASHSNYLSCYHQTDGQYAG